MFATSTSEFLAWGDLALKILAVVALATGVLQLREARRKRHVDLYWELMDRYLSPDGRELRNVMRLLERQLALDEQAPLRPRSVSAWTEDMRRAAAQSYNELFHDTEVEGRQHVHPAVLYRLRYLNQAGVLLQKNLVDRDLLLGLIAAGVRIDRAVIEITLAAVREREGFCVYPQVEYVIAEVDRYTS